MEIAFSDNCNPIILINYTYLRPNVNEISSGRRRAVVNNFRFASRVCYFKFITRVSRRINEIERYPVEKKYLLPKNSRPNRFIYNIYDVTRVCECNDG